jgi:hypothetical protein
MSDVYKKYKNIPVTGIDLSKLKKFFQGNGPYRTLLQVGLLPNGATVSEMVLKCSSAIEELYSKYEKYKEMGYVKDELQLMALGQLSNNSKVIQNFLIARNWKYMPDAEKSNKLTKGKFVKFLSDWFGFHKNRIGWEGISRSPVMINDPENPGKRIKYYMSDRYNKPINQCKQPPIKLLARYKELWGITLSVAQSEQILLRVADRFKNENDMVYFSPDRRDETDAYTVIRKLSGFGTDPSLTAAGTKAEFQNTIREIAKARERGKIRKQQELTDIKTEADAQRAINEVDSELARKAAERESYKQKYSATAFKIDQEKSIIEQINQAQGNK